MKNTTQTNPRGDFYGIGLGPGDPELLTIKAARILEKADAIIVPKAKKDSQSVARDIVSRALGDSLPFVEMVFPMVLELSELKPRWDEAAAVILERLNKGEHIAFVTLGDVSLYSTFFYLQQSLKELDSTIQCNLIPGISSIQLAAARFDTPLAIADESLGVYPLPDRIEDLDSAVKEHDKIVIMKIGRRLEELKTYLGSRDLLSCASYIRRAGFPDEYQTSSLDTLPTDETAYLSLIFLNLSADS